MYYYIEYRQIIITSTCSDSHVISETFSVSDVTRQYSYYFQWGFWQLTIPIYEVCDCKIFKSFSLHCSLLLTMVIPLNYFAIYIILKTNSCIDSFTIEMFIPNIEYVLNFFQDISQKQSTFYHIISCILKQIQVYLQFYNDTVDSSSVFLRHI